MKPTLQYFSFAVISCLLAACISGCANIIPPGGGPRDSIPPVLVSATPSDSSRNISPERITLSFDEYIAPLQNIDQVIISPTLPRMPSIESKLRNVTIRMHDTLESNTTYSINFGNTIKDVNENNILEDFTYVFSTGDRIDENMITGKVVLAETGKTDSTLIVILHNDLTDSAIMKKRPRYYTRLDGEGNFRFRNLPSSDFAVYVLESNNPFMQYSDSTMMFAFLDQPVGSAIDPSPVLLYAYQEAKRQDNRSSGTTASSGSGGRDEDRRLRYTISEGRTKDVLTPLQLDFVRKLASFDSTKFQLTDTSFNPLGNYLLSLDSNYTRVSIHHPWAFGTGYKLIIQKDAVADGNGTTLVKTDTVSFTTKPAESYGGIRIRLNNLDVSRNPVLQIIQNDAIIVAAPMAGREYRNDVFIPGEYELRILYDENGNGTWDPGNFKKKKQPEIVLSLSRKFTVRANWDNEEEITLVQ